MTHSQLSDIQIIQDFVKLHDRLPTYTENTKTSGFPNGAYWRKNFGTFNNALLAAGYVNPNGAILTQVFKCSWCGDEFRLSGAKLSGHKQSNKGHTHFCSKSCSARFTNMHREPKSDQVKLKIRQSVKRYRDSLPKTIVGPYSKLFTCTCAHCNFKFVSRQQRKYCTQHTDMYKSGNRNRYAFTFSLSDHPTLFPNLTELLTTYGMWSYTNTTGITRDHRISVNESIKRGYDPYYIKHPVNCELMSWSDNNKKKTQCSITYSELISWVNEYDKNYMLTS